MRGIQFEPIDGADEVGRNLAWRLNLPYDTVVRLELPLDAPFGPPHAFLERPDPLTVKWRNVETNGAMCLFEPSASRFPMLHPGAVLEVLDSIVRIVVANRDGEAPADIVLERQHWATHFGICTSLIAPHRVPLTGVACAFREGWLLAETESECRDWAARTFEDLGRTRPLAARWLDEVSQLPTTQADLSYDERCNLDSGGMLLYFLNTDSGPLGFAVALDVADALHRLPVSRADRTWLHQRGGTGLDQAIGTARVAIIGCGSLGAGVAELLVKTGVGSLVLIDHDHLAWDNVARHTLGGQDVGRSKVRALATRLCSHLPSLAEVDTQVATWQAVAADSPHLLECDLIVSTIAVWPDELALAQWTAQRGVPLVLGWIEGRAVAAHAVALQGGCLACLFTPSGAFMRAASWWMDESPFAFAESCHEQYMPYGYTDIVPAQALIATLATDLLAGRVEGDLHRCRLPNRNVMDSVSASPSPDYRHLEAQGLLSARWQELERNWPSHAQCWYCGGLRPWDQPGQI